MRSLASSHALVGKGSSSPKQVRFRLHRKRTNSARWMAFNSRLYSLARHFGRSWELLKNATRGSIEPRRLIHLGMLTAAAFSWRSRFSSLLPSHLSLESVLMMTLFLSIQQANSHHQARSGGSDRLHSQHDLVRSSNGGGDGDDARRQTGLVLPS